MPAAPEERERDLPGERERGEPVSVGSIEPKWGIQTAEPVSAGSIEPKWGIRQRAGGHVIQKQFRNLQQFRIAFRGAQHRLCWRPAGRMQIAHPALAHYLRDAEPARPTRHFLNHLSAARTRAARAARSAATAAHAFARNVLEPPLVTSLRLATSRRE